MSLTSIKTGALFQTMLVLMTVKCVFVYACSHAAACLDCSADPRMKKLETFFGNGSRISL